MAQKRRPTGTTARSTSDHEKGGSPQFPLLSSINEKKHGWVFAGIILLSLIVFFSGVIFTGEYFAASDNISWESFRTYLAEMKAEGESPLWIPYIFSGMPGVAAYLVTGDRWWDLIMKIVLTAEDIFGVINYPVMRMVMYYFFLGLGTYLLMRVKKVTHGSALFTALAVVFSTWIIVWVMIGHNTKVMTLAALPYIFICIEKLFKKWSLLWAALLVAAVHVLAESGHIQTAFYAAAGVGIYLLVELVGAFRERGEGQMAGVLRSAGMLVVAAAFAYGMGLDRYLAVQEYVPYSTRGAAAIVDTATTTDAELYEYATNWSFSFGETFTYLVPNYYGFGKLDAGGDIAGIPPDAGNIPTYWGQMPFTDAAHYMGIAVLILGLFGAWTWRRNRFVQGMFFTGLFGLLLAFGNNPPSFLYDLFYDYFPSFAKFRAPSQSLVLLEFAFPILAGFGIESLLAMRRAGGNEKVEKNLLYMAGAAGLFLLIGLAGGSLLKAGYIQSVSQAENLAATFGGQVPPSVAEFIYSQMITDWIFAGVFGIAVLLLMRAFLKGKVTAGVLQLTLIGILLIDLWRVDYRAMETEDYDEAFAVFNEDDIDQYLAADTTQFRVLDLASQNPNFPARQLQQHILGYSSVKMRRYQDLLDVAGNGQIPTSPLAWDLLNTKYVIAEGPIAPGMEPVFSSQYLRGQSGPVTVFERPSAMPRAWFVDSVAVAEDLRVLEMIRDTAFDPRAVAFVPEPIPATISPVDVGSARETAPVDSPAPGSADTTAISAADTVLPAPVVEDHSARDELVNLTLFKPLEIELDVNAPDTSFLVLSEIYFPPGWQAYIDGEPVETYRANYLLRGLIVPPGDHDIRFEYTSDAFETGRWVSLALNIIVLAAIIVGFLQWRRRRESDVETTPAQEPAE